MTSLTVASPDYFAAMSIPVRRGRLFTADDHPNAPQVAIINDLLADRFWPGESPLDQRITVNWQGRWRTMQVVGVGPPSPRRSGPGSAPGGIHSVRAVAVWSMTFVVRTTTDAALLIATLKKQIWDVDPNLPLCDTSTIEALVAQSLAPRRFITSLLTVLAGLAFVLATIGIYGIVSSRPASARAKSACASRLAEARATS